MATCSNCKATLSCGCQKRTASDGKSACTKCLTSYEATLKKQKTITVEAPKQTWGADRYKTN